MNRLRIALLIFLVAVLGTTGCTAGAGAPSGFDREFASTVKPYSFNFAAWEYRTLLEQSRDNLSGRSSSSVQAPAGKAVAQYFFLAGQIDTLNASASTLAASITPSAADSRNRQLAALTAQRFALQRTVEATIARQISSVLESQGIAQTAFGMTFPPVNFKLEKPLSVLVVSPRDKIQSIRSVTVKQGLSQSEVEALEQSVDGLNVSSLVIEIGGLGATYPTFVVDNSNLKWTIETATHEWLHQYLAFRPLGFNYLLDLFGASVDPALITINETVANIAGQELGEMVYQRYYAAETDSPSMEVSPPPAPPGAFDFNKEMREIRLAVDDYLAHGQVAEAEAFMNEKQQFLASQGYYIRKLNQAYFAFYGSYADAPTSIDPVGNKLKLVRAGTASAKDFLDVVAGIRHASDLDKIVARYAETR